MNWFEKWKWFYRQGVGDWYFHENYTTTYFYYKHKGEKVRMGSFEIKRNWIEKL